MNRSLKSIIDVTLLSIIALILFLPINAEAAPSINYRVHVSGYGWMGTVSDGQIAGTTGEGRQMEAIIIDSNRDILSYCVHVKGDGWQSWRSSGDIAGTTGENKRMEAIRIQLNGSAANKYDVYYRVHVSGYGWMDLVSNGSVAGTVGESRRIEAIQIVLRDRNDSGYNNGHRNSDRYDHRHRQRYDRW